MVGDKHAAEIQRFGFFRRRLGTWVGLSQYGFPFSVGPQRTPVARFRALARRSLRIVTGMDGDGRAAFITALAAFPHGARTTSIGGILCSLDRKTGRIRQASLPNAEPIVKHPDTGAPLLGALLPFWRESLELAERAHAAAFPRFAFLGWDIALTAEGPLLLETNAGWGALFH